MKLHNFIGCWVGRTCLVGRSRAPSAKNVLVSGIWFFLAACSQNNVDRNAIAGLGSAPTATIQTSARNITVNASVTLDGSQSSDPEGQALSYLWSIIGGPTGGQLQNETLANAIFNATQPGTYTIQLSVTDGGNSAQSTVTITVTNVATQNRAPIAQAGADQNLTQGQTANLNAAGSSDPDGDALTYFWEVINNPAGSATSFGNVSGQQTTFVGNQVGAYEIRLTISDGSLIDQDLVIVQLTDPSSNNAAPIAQAGADQLITLGQSVVLSGAASSDPDGDSLSFAWTLLSRPNGSTANLTAPSSVQTNLNVDITGDYVAQLTVSDGQLSAQDSVTIQVMDSGPTVESGPLSFELASVEVVPAGRIRYQLTVGNTSATDILANANLLLRLPQQSGDFSDDGDVEPNVSCGTSCNPGEELTWALGDLAPGESRSFDVNGRVQSDLAVGSEFSTTARLTSNSLSNDVEIVRIARVIADRDVQLTLTPSQDAVVAGNTYRYTLDVGNGSNGAISNALLNLTLPEGVTAQTVSDGGIASGQSVTWPAASLLTGSALQRSVNVLISSSVAEGNTLDAKAQLSYDGGPPVDREVHSPISVSAPVDLDVSFSSAQSDVEAGGRLRYQLSLSNTSTTNILPNVVAMLRLPEQSGNFSDDGDVEPDVSCGTSCNPGEELFWSLGDLAPGQSVTLDVNALLRSDLTPGDLIETQLRVTGNTLNDTIVERRTARVIADRDVQLTLTPSKDAVLAGSTYRYTLDVGNGSNGAISNALLNLTLPAGVTAQTVSDGGSASDQSVTWPAASLLTGNALQRSVDVIVSSFVVEGSSLDAKAQLSYDGGPSVEREANSPVSVSAPLDLDVSYSFAQSDVEAGGRLRYQLNLGNSSTTNILPNVVVMLRLPEQSGNFSDDGDVEPNVSCGTSCNPGEELFWSLGDLAPGQSVTLDVNALLRSDLTPGDLIETQLRVTGNTLNDTIVERRTARVIADRDVQLTLTPSQDAVLAGSTYRYTLDVGNGSNGAISNALLNLTLPEGVTAQTVSDGGSASGQSVAWPAASLSSGATLQRSVDVSLSASAAEGSNLESVGRLSYDGGSALDREVQSPVSVSAPLGLDVSYTFAQSDVVAGGRLRYELILSNTSITNILPNMVAMLRLPEQSGNFSDDADVEPDVSCGTSCNPGEELFWSLGDLAPGQSVTLDVNALLRTDISPGDLIETQFRVTGNNLGDTVVERRTARVVSP
ncbi:MAG: PKD domain-containing protein [Oceanococcus sp.]